MENFPPKRLTGREFVATLWRQGTVKLVASAEAVALIASFMAEDQSWLPKHRAEVGLVALALFAVAASSAAYRVAEERDRAWTQRDSENLARLEHLEKQLARVLQRSGRASARLSSLRREVATLRDWKKVHEDAPVAAEARKRADGLRAKLARGYHLARQMIALRHSWSAEDDRGSGLWHRHMAKLAANLREPKLGQYMGYLSAYTSGNGRDVLQYRLSLVETFQFGDDEVALDFDHKDPQWEWPAN